MPLSECDCVHKVSASLPEFMLRFKQVPAGTGQNCLAQFLGPLQEFAAFGPQGAGFGLMRLDNMLELGDFIP
jgi:hypothetical protein